MPFVSILKVSNSILCFELCLDINIIYLKIYPSYTSNHILLNLSKEPFNIDIKPYIVITGKGPGTPDQGSFTRKGADRIDRAPSCYIDIQALLVIVINLYRWGNHVRDRNIGRGFPNPTGVIGMGIDSGYCGRRRQDHAGISESLLDLIQLLGVGGSRSAGFWELRRSAGAIILICGNGAFRQGHDSGRGNLDRAQM